MTAPVPASIGTGADSADAAAFDVALVVRFAPFSELVEWDAKLSSDSLDVKSYDQDSFCQWMKEGDSAATSCEQNVPAPGASENDVFREEYWSEKSSLSFTERIPAAMAG